MKVTVWGINYTPELTGIAPYNQAICEYLAKQGHSVRIVCGFPYYPKWSKAPTDKGKLFRTEEKQGVKVHRCWQFVPKKPRAATRILHELSFVFMSFLRMLFLPRPDALVVISPPLLLGPAAWVYSCIKRTPIWFHVQDLQPDAAYALGLLKKGLLAKILYAIEGFGYRKADRVSGISQGMLDAFAKKGVPEEKIVYFPNGVDLPRIESYPACGAFRKRFGVADSAFIAAYSGNLGVKQGLDIILETARLIKNPNIKIVISGDGARREELHTRARELGLSNVLILPLQPENQFQEMLVDTDLALITQQTGTGQFFFPSKLLRNLAFGKPILTVADECSELSRALRQGGFGMNVEPDRPAELARAIETMARQDNLGDLGRAGRNFVSQFEFERVLLEFEGGLCAMCSGDDRIMDNLVTMRPGEKAVSKSTLSVELQP